jgi:hypothetical protein
MEQSEPQNAGNNQKDSDDVIEQLRHDQNKNAGEQRDDRLKVRYAYGHYLLPLTVA